MEGNHIWRSDQELCFQFVLLSIEHVSHILWEPLSGYWVNDWHWEREDSDRVLYATYLSQWMVFTNVSRIL